MAKCPHCPVAGPCHAYPALCERVGREPELWRPVLDRHNAVMAARGEYPPLLEQAGNLARAAGRVVADVAAGRPATVPAEEQARRLAICAECREYDAYRERCRMCGCAAVWKAKLSSESCPLNKW